VLASIKVNIPIDGNISLCYAPLMSSGSDELGDPYSKSGGSMQPDIQVMAAAEDNTSCIVCCHNIYRKVCYTCASFYNGLKLQLQSAHTSLSLTRVTKTPGVDRHRGLVPFQY